MEPRSVSLKVYNRAGDTVNVCGKLLYLLLVYMISRHGYVPGSPVPDRKR